MKQWHVLGNKQANFMADAGDEIHKVPVVKAIAILNFIDNLHLIQARLIALMKLFPHRNRNKKATEGGSTATKSSNLALACTKSMHCCIRQRTIMYCSDCKMSVSTNAKHVFDTL